MCAAQCLGGEMRGALHSVVAARSDHVEQKKVNLLKNLDVNFYFIPYYSWDMENQSFLPWCLR